MKYNNRPLTIEEQNEFKDLYHDNLNNNKLAKQIMTHRVYAFIYPCNIILLLTIVFSLYRSIISNTIAFIAGLLSNQLIFIISHIWAHSLMLDYSLWNIRTMSRKMGQIP